MSPPRPLRTLAVLWLAAGCPAPAPELSGAPEVTVEAMGPVEQAPQVVRGDETVDVTWTLDDEAVATVEEGRIVAVGPGETRVTTEVDGQVLGFDLIVDVDLTLVPAGPLPSQLAVGEQLDLQTSARVGEVAATARGVRWTSSDPARVAVGADGRAHALQPGWVYLTGRQGDAALTVELQVVE